MDTWIRMGMNGFLTLRHRAATRATSIGTYSIRIGGTPMFDPTAKSTTVMTVSHEG